MQKVVGEKLLDHVALVAKANNEVVDSKRRVDFHDVPEDWPPANFDHRLRSKRGFLTQTAAESSSQNDCFHLLFPIPSIHVLYPYFSFFVNSVLSFLMAGAKWPLPLRSKAPFSSQSMPYQLFMEPLSKSRV
jgi:hypothetical protein